LSNAAESIISGAGWFLALVAAIVIPRYELKRAGITISEAFDKLV
jgi:hypothetical protein